MTHYPRGYIALISAIIISVVLLGLATAIGQSTFFSRFNALNREYKRISLGLAESCVHAALSKISNNYDYTIQGDPDYDAHYDDTTAGVVVDLGQVYGRDTECVITGPTTHPNEVDGKKTFAIAAKASYAGAFSTLAVSATAQDPETAPVVPPPSCAIVPTSISVPSGQSFSFSWNSTGADTFSMNRGVGSLSIPDGTRTITPTSAPGTYEYEATVTNAGGTNTCAIEVTVTPPPPAPACADTMMMLDRSYSMFGYPDYPSGYTQWVPNEKNAAKVLVDLYDSVSSNPRVGFGRIADTGTGRGADLVTMLTNSYAALKSAIDNGMPELPIGYTNLGAAINVAHTELESVRHDPDKQKVLIFVSDGVPNQPESGIPGDTGWRSPLATASPNEWSNPTSAFSSNDIRATADDDDDDQGYRTFNFSIPSNAAIRGIEVRMEAFSSTGGPVATSLFTDGFGTGNTDGSFNEAPAWTEGGNGAEKRASGSGNDSASPEGGRFAAVNSGGWICQSVNAAGLSDLQLSYRWRGDTAATQSDDDGIVELRTGGSCTSTSGWTTLQNHDLRTTTWATQSAFMLPGSVNNTTFYLRYRASSDSGEDFRIDTVAITGNAPAPNSSCQLQARIGDSGNWSSFRSVTLSGTETVFTPLGGATDDWDNVGWSAGDFSNGNFRLETRFNDPDTNCADTAVAQLDHVDARVHYEVPTDPTEFARQAANDAKSDGVDIFSIHFGDTSGMSFMQELASPSTLPAATIQAASRNGGTATITTHNAHRLTRNQRAQITGVSQSAFNGTFTILSVPTPTTFTYALSGSSLSGNGGSVRPLNLFASPSSSDMTGIFQSIGYQVCPAAAPQCSNNIDDDLDGLSDDMDGGCHTDGIAENIGSYNPLDTDEWTTPAVPAPPAPPPPPPNIQIGSWREVP